MEPVNAWVEWRALAEKLAQRLENNEEEVSYGGEED